MKMLVVFLFVLNGLIAAQAIVISPLQDSYIRANAATTAFGATNPNQLRVKLETTGNPNQFHRKTYLQYDISTGTVGFDPTTSLGSAAFDFTFIATSPLVGSSNGTLTFEFEVFGLNDAFDETWDQASITYNNAPGNDSAAGNAVTGDATSLGTFDLFDRAGTVNFASSQLDAFLAADTDGLATFILVRNTPQNGANTVVHIINSIETGNSGALLTLNAAAVGGVPEPSSVLMMGAIMAGCRFVRRRRK